MDGGKVAARRRRGTQPSKGDRRNTAILDAAEEQLVDSTIDTMTVESIAKSAGLTRNALYFYYGSKQEVLTALVHRTVDLISSDAAVAEHDVDSDPREVIIHAVRSIEKMWTQHHRVMRAAVDLGAVIPEIGVLWTNTVETYVSAMAAVLSRAGLADTDAGSPREIATALCWMTERSFYRAFAAGAEPEAIARTGNVCIAIWLSVLPR